jgi:putative dehydrogenase|tara:strand:- start:5495 stop:6388 length:894 start_codon:yes stop_codon:yes gene_type:complete
VKVLSNKEGIGIVGLGVLGSAIAENFINKNIQISGYDISRKSLEKVAKKKIVIYETLDTLVIDNRYILLSLPSEKSLIDTANNLKNNNNQDLIIIETSTLPIDCKLNAKEILLQKNITLFDAPLSGNRLAALEGKLSAYLSGENNNKDLIKEILEVFCTKVTDVGEFGNGTKMKLIGNILNLVHNAVAGEVMALGIKSGLDPEMIYDAISGTFSSSGVFESRGKLMVEEDYEKEGMNFSTPIKDSTFITDLSKKYMVPLPIYQVALQYYYAAVAQGHFDKDAASILKVLEKNANISR